jgi:hypothetical protein
MPAFGPWNTSRTRGTWARLDPRKQGNLPAGTPGTPGHLDPRKVGKWRISCMGMVATERRPQAPPGADTCARACPPAPARARAGACPPGPTGPPADTRERARARPPARVSAPGPARRHAPGPLRARRETPRQGLVQLGRRHLGRRHLAPETGLRTKGSGGLQKRSCSLCACCRRCRGILANSLQRCDCKSNCFT